MNEKYIFEQYCLFFFNIHSNNNKVGSVFHPTSGQINLTYGSSDWPNCDLRDLYEVIHQTASLVS